MAMTLCGRCGAKFTPGPNKECQECLSNEDLDKMSWPNDLADYEDYIYQTFGKGLIQ